MNQEELAKAIANCANEPIHIPGKIQPHGLLLAFTEPGYELVQISANCNSFLGKSPEAVLGHSLTELLTSDSVEKIDAALALSDLQAANPLRLETKQNKQVYDGILHRSGLSVVLELEPDLGVRPANFLPLIQRIRSISHLIQATKTLDQTFAVVVGIVQELTGFDRVLVYQFDAEFNGQVVGEAKQPDQEPYLDLRYPASDIPPQARQLYLRNWLRIIPDVLYEPVAIVPELNPTSGTPLDLSFSILRSVSPVHIQYLKNFGVRSSMSISIVKDAQLWGLITCMHRQPRLISYELRSICEFFGSVLSFQIARLQSQNIYDKRLHVHAMQAELQQEIAAHGVITGFKNLSNRLLNIVAAAGAALVIKNKVHCFGVTPSVDEIIRLSIWLRQNQSQSQKIFSTERLPALFPPAEQFLEVACGVLAVSLDSIQGDYIVWFRPEIVQTVKWGGKPYSEEQIQDDKLTPRHSFALWKEQVRMRSEAWQSWEIEGAEELRRNVIDVNQRSEMARINLALEAKALELEKLNKAKDEFLALVSHELRSPLSIIIGYAELLRHEKFGTELFGSGIEAIIRSARTQAQLIADLLDVSRIITGKLSLDLSAVSIKELVTDASDSMRFAAQ